MILRVIIDHNQYIIRWVLYPLRLKSIDHSIIIPLLVVSINPKFKIIPQVWKSGYEINNLDIVRIRVQNQ